MQLNYIAFVIPAFFLVCAIEYFLSVKKEKKVFSFAESISNLNVGLFERVCDIFTTSLFYFYFEWLYKNYAIFDIKSNIITWFLLLLATDFVWYWYHRFGHTINLLWAAHIVHHQSNDFNFTTAARITCFQSFFRSIFWSFIPILGFSPEMITIILLIHGAYPLFTHTQLVRKLGFIEKIFVTPSHHRVHHSSNKRYWDKNFGDIFIFWDKIFGTFAEESDKEKIVYGISRPLESYSFLWQHFHYLIEIIASAYFAKGFKNKWNTILGPPKVIDPNIRKKIETKYKIIHQKAETSKMLSRAITINTVIIILFEFFYILLEHYQNLYQLLLGALIILVSVIITGAMLEQRRWIFHLEIFRIIILSGYIALSFPNIAITFSIITILILILAFYNSASKTYLNYLKL